MTAIDRPMKIGILCYPTYGGSGVVATELGISLADRGHEIHFVTYEQPFRLHTFHDNVFFHAVSVMQYPLFRYPPYTMASASRLTEVAETHGLDIVHAHYAVPHTVAALLARQVLDSRIKVVTTLHGTDITLVGQDPSFFAMTRWGIEQSDAVTAVSDYLRRETVQVFGTQRPIEVVHNFIDLERFRPMDRRHPNCVRRHHAPKGERLIIHVSNFRPVKRVQDVVRAFAQMHAAMPVRLLMVGDGQDLPEARALATRLGVAADVVWLGRQEIVEELIPCADLMLMPSEHESFGLAALESLACGVPVVATQGSGLGEVVEDGVCGRLVPVGDVDAMAAAGVEILGDESRCQRMSKAARQQAAKFRLDEIIPQYEALYARLLTGAGAEASARR